MPSDLEILRQLTLLETIIPADWATRPGAFVG
jgi:hypothetical protein